MGNTHQLSRGDLSPLSFLVLIMDKQIKHCGIYLDWDNIWGGILTLLEIKVVKDINKRKPLESNQKEKIKTFMSEFSSKLCQSPQLGEEIRYIKAFADFDRLPHAVDFNPSISSLLHNSGIEPFISFVNAGGMKIKDASDRSLILEVIEDVFFSKKPIDTVIIASGDVDFYPLAAFIREHSDKRVRILSFKNRMSDFFKNLPSLRNELIFIEDIMGDAINKITEPLELPLETAASGNYELFKNRLVSGIKKWKEKKGAEVKTGLIINSWLPKWEISISAEEANAFLKKLIEDNIIEIKADNPDLPLNGIIIVKE